MRQKAALKIPEGPDRLRGGGGGGGGGLHQSKPAVFCKGLQQGMPMGLSAFDLHLEQNLCSSDGIAHRDNCWD